MALEISNLGRRISGDIGFPHPQYNIGLEYYVDGVGGDDDNSGRTWDYAFKTIQAALDAHGLLYNGANRKFDVIWIKPGVYAENLTGDLTNHNFFDCHIIGLGLHGDDSQAEIHPGTGSCFAGIANGLHLSNLWLEVDEQNASILDFEICNNTVIEDCVFTMFADVTGVIGIDTENSAWLVVRRCRFTSGQLHDLAYGIYNRGGANKYAHNNQYHDNDIFADVGIYIAADCTATQATIKHNLVVASVGIGIDDNNGGSYVIDNDVYAPATPIDHAGGPAHTIRNRVQVGAGATADWQTPD